MDWKSRTVITFTVINVAAAVVALGALVYIKGHYDGQVATRAQAQAHSVGSAVVPNPHVGQGQHPVFDCSSMATSVPAPAGDFVSIGALDANAASYAGKPIAIHGRVVQAFPKIMGVNWFHVCDEPNGAVLVASGTDWVEPGHVVTVRGTLSVNQNIGGAYTFPLYVGEAKLEGQNVETSPRGKPIGVYDL